ncbi:MAG: 2-oxoacid:acceptor oxidoreductase family protein [Thermodesulfobacteriota bacterium]|nr:2-oxoacid:acceptor oxidoreductase family protein [Thermodesulfobacteriota bacterium]
MERQEIRFAGFGGQGLLLAGILLGKTAALYAGKQAAQTQSYGTEARGGASQCNVVIDDKEITYVGVVNPDVFVVMSQEAYDKLIGEVKEKGLVFYDSDLVKIKENPNIRQIPIASTSTAKDMGRQMVANVVMLGAMVEGTKILDVDWVKACLKESVPQGTEELNLKAFDTGRSLFKP